MIEKVNGRYRSIRTNREFDKSVQFELESLTPDEKEFLYKMLREVGESEFDPESGVSDGDLCLWEALSDIEYKTPPVDMETFIYDDYYMGEIGKTLYPCWAKDLEELFEGGYHEAIIGGSIGCGKTVFAQMAAIRMIYEISCMRDPQRSFGLEKGSEVTFQNISSVKTLAEDAIIGGIGSKLKLSPYFNEEFVPSISKGKILFPGNIQLVASASDMKGLLSLNTFGGIFDEVNFIGQTKSKAGGDTEKMTKLYTQTLRRMKSRYQIGGKLPGMLLMISSKNLKSSFTEKRILKSMEDPTVFVREYSLWDVKRGRYSKKTFFVFAGNSKINSYVLKDASEENLSKIQNFINTDDRYEECKLIEVPIDFKKDFEDNIDEALQDIAGIAVDTISRFIYRSGKIEDAIDYSRQHPCDVMEWIADESLAINWSKLVKKYITKDRYGHKETFIAPIINPESMRFVHIDTSEKKDCTGVVIGHVDRMVKVKRRDSQGNEYYEEAPYIIIDFMLRVRPPKGDSIILADIRTIIYAFIDHGFNITNATTDSYQSLEMRQYMDKKGIETDILSVDRTPTPYKMLRSCFYEDRISIYDYPPFIDEIGKLIYDREKQKIDHIEGESKDVSDGVAGVVFSATEKMPVGAILPEIGISEYDGDDEYEDESWVLDKGTGIMIKDGEGIGDIYLPIM